MIQLPPISNKSGREYSLQVTWSSFPSVSLKQEDVKSNISRTRLCVTKKSISSGIYIHFVSVLHWEKSVQHKQS